MTLLILRLEGAMLSFGTRSRFDDRDTGDMPTKSAVVGLLSCALGYPRGDERISVLNTALRMGARADRAGRMALDYQTITRQTGHLFNAAGKERVVPDKPSDSPDTIISKRQYLQDACYTVVLAGDREVLHACADALSAPVWQVFLGHKAFPPSRPVLETLTDEYAGIEDALRRFPPCACVVRRRARLPLDRRARPMTMRCEMDDLNGMFLRQDILRESGVLYDRRRVQTFYIQMEGGTP